MNFVVMNNMATDTEVILMSLQKERDDLHERIMQVDRIIKRVKSLEYSPSNEVTEPKKLEDKEQQVAPLNLFPKTADIKVLVLRSFDMLNIACKLKAVQSVYTEISGNQYNIREAMRTLNKNKLLVRILEKRTNKGFLWVKSEWIEDGKLIDKYKPDGFDLLYKPENLIYV